MDPPVIGGSEPQAEVQTQEARVTHTFFVANPGVKSSGRDVAGLTSWKKMHFFVDDRY